MIRFLSKYTWENLFYLLSAWIVFSSLSDFRDLALHMEMAQWELPVSLFPPSSDGMYLLYAQWCIAVFLFLALIPKRWPFLGIGTWWMILALMGSFGKHSHSLHGWTTAALGMTIAFLIDRKDNRLSYEYAIVGGTFIYCASGFWKLRSLLGQEDMLFALENSLTYQMGYGLAEHYRDEGFVILRWFLEHPLAAGASWCIVMLTQILTPLAVLFLPRLRCPLMFVLVFFHVGAELIIGPAFTVQRQFLFFMAVVSCYYEWWRPSRITGRWF